MNYIIDGHNLIPKIPGFALSDPDDEQHLVELIYEYCRITRAHAELYFDGAPHAQKSPQGGGLVHTHYIRKGIAADDAIIAFLHQAGKNARNYTVVTSDHRIQAEARAVSSPVLLSEEFAREMVTKFRSSTVAQSKGEPHLSSAEMDQWLEIFGTDQDKNS